MQNEPPAEPPISNQGPSSCLVRHWIWAALAVILLFSLVIHVRLWDIPLERDEGEYAYIAQQMLKGIVPFKSAYTMKFPGVAAMYAPFIWAFGATPRAVHICLTAVTVSTIGLLMLLARRKLGHAASIVVAATYTLLSLQFSALAFAGHATHFVVLAAIAGLLLLDSAIQQQRPWHFAAAGLLLGLCPLMKQHGVAFLIFGLLYLAQAQYRQRQVKWGPALSRLMLLGGFGLLPMLLLFLVMWQQGVFGRFWFWTVQYASTYANSLTLSQGWANLKLQFSHQFGASALLWSFCLSGLIGFGFVKEVHRHWVFFLGLLLFSFIGMCPGYYFREHYFILIMPALALLAGVSFLGLQRLSLIQPLSAPVLGTLVFLGVIAYSVYGQRIYLFQASPNAISRMAYGSNPFVESLDIGKFLKEHCPPNAKIAILGSEPQIAFYAERLSATGYIYVYPLMEAQPFARSMQEEAAAEISSADPDYLIFVDIGTSWLAQPQSDRWIFSWFQQYQRRMQLVAGVLITPNGSYTIPSDQLSTDWNKGPSMVIFKRPS